jgi:hypothetical protein
MSRWALMYLRDTRETQGHPKEHRSRQAAGYAITRASVSLGTWDVIRVGSTEACSYLRARHTSYSLALAPV